MGLILSMLRGDCSWNGRTVRLFCWDRSDGLLSPSLMLYRSIGRLDVSTDYRGKFMIVSGSRKRVTKGFLNENTSFVYQSIASIT